MSETPNTVHGRLLEAAHIAGYTFKRACDELDWLLENDRWQQLGFKNGSEFVRSMTGAFSEFQIDKDERRPLAEKLKKIASQRAVGEALGVNKETVARDLGKRDGANAPLDDEPSPEPAAETSANGANAPPREWFQTDADPTAQAKREARREAKAAEVERIAVAPAALPDGCFDVIVIDPPWPMEKIEREVAPNQVGFDYPTMTEEELLAYGAEVESRAADNCHLFLWTTHKFLPFALSMAEHWGFKYVCLFTWHKPGGFQPFGLPQYNSEFVIYARRGTPKFTDTKAFPCCFHAPRREHSRKPDAFYATVLRVTSGRRADWFARAPRDGFEVVGNETEKFTADVA